MVLLSLKKEAETQAKPEGRITMKKRLQQILSLLCILALALGCVTTAALAEQQTESRIIAVQWEDGSSPDDNRPEIAVAYSAAGFSTTLNKANEWKAEVSVTAGTTGDWTWTTPDGYTVQANKVNDIATVLTVRAKSAATTSESASVVWVDENNAKGVRPESLQLALLANGKPYGEPKTVKAPAWKATWDNLPLTDDAGKAIDYTVSQLQQPAGYVSDVNKLTVTNTLQTAKLGLKVTLEGVPEGADVSKLRLILDGPDPAVHNVTLTYGQLAGGTADFGDVLPGAYLVRNNNADLLIEGYIMDTENSKVSDAVYVKPGETASLEFKYAWKLPEGYEAEEDYDPTANIGNLSFDILGPDPRMPLQNITYAQFTNGKYELQDLVPGVYTVIERNAETLIKYYTLTSESITGMTLNVAPNGTATAKLYNQYVPAQTPEPDAEFVNIPVTKSWNDNYNADGNRPESITVRLFADGVEVDSHVLIPAEGWAYTFMDKPRYQEDHKTEIKYAVREDEVPMYSQEVNGYNIVNNYSPAEVSASVSKVWNDTNNAQGTRPIEVAMILYNGVTEEPAAVVLLGEANGWTATVNHLPTIVNGQKAVYAWKEQQVLGYTLDYVEQRGNHMTFTNSIWTRPENPTQGKKPKTPGQATYIFEDYDTPLGVEIVINHVGDCFD